MFIYLHPHSRKENDLVAQLVEHITFNDGVLGSSPSQVTENLKDVAMQRLYFFKAMWRNGRLAILRGWCSQGREGSNPSMVTNIYFLQTLFLFFKKNCLIIFLIS